MSTIKGDDLHRIFKNLDKNNLGRVSIRELHHLLERVGIHSTLEELEKLVGGETLGYVDFLFFYEAMVKARKGEAKDDDDHVQNEDLLQAFGVFDLNGDGFISSDELQSVLSRLGLWDKSCGRDCKEMIHVYDHNLDGALDFEEFKVMMSNCAVPAASDDVHSSSNI